MIADDAEEAVGVVPDELQPSPFEDEPLYQNQLAHPDNYWHLILDSSSETLSDIPEV